MEFNEYQKISVANDVVILSVVDKDEKDKRKVPEKELQILLIRRDENPFKNLWSLPGGFVDYNKDIETCTKEKLEIKTGIKDLYMEQLFTYGDLNRDPRGRVITVAYLSLVRKENVVIKNTGINETKWFKIKPIRDINQRVFDIVVTINDKEIELAFDHRKIIIDSINRLQNKLEYTDVVFNLMPKEFTIKELEMTFECLLGRSIPAFRRKFKDKLTATETIKDDGSAYRPAELYTKKED